LGTVSEPGTAEANRSFKVRSEKDIWDREEHRDRSPLGGERGRGRESGEGEGVLWEG
jgi:hypothetical protein